MELISNNFNSFYAHLLVNYTEKFLLDWSLNSVFICVFVFCYLVIYFIIFWRTCIFLALCLYCLLCTKQVGLGSSVCNCGCVSVRLLTSRLDCTVVSVLLKCTVDCLLLCSWHVMDHLTCTVITRFHKQLTSLHLMKYS